MALLSKDRIVAAARLIVERGGAEQLSLRNLAAQLGVTAPALYDHIASKDEVLRAVATEGFASLEASYRITGSRAIERVRERALGYVAFARDSPELFRLMFLYRPNAVAIEVDNELSAATDVFEAAVADVREAIADGDLVDRDPDQLGLTLWASIHGVATVATIAPSVAVSVADHVIDALLAGLRPSTGPTMPAANTERRRSRHSGSGE